MPVIHGYVKSDEVICKRGYLSSPCKSRLQKLIDCVPLEYQRIVVYPYGESWITVKGMKTAQEQIDAGADFLRVVALREGEVSYIYQNDLF